MRRALRIVGKVVGWTIVGTIALVVLAVATVFLGVRTEWGARLVLDTALGYAHRYLDAPITVARGSVV